MAPASQHPSSAPMHVRAAMVMTTVRCKSTRLLLALDISPEDTPLDIVLESLRPKLTRYEGANVEVEQAPCDMGF